MKKTRNTIILALSLCIAVTAWSAARSRAKAKPVTQEQPSARLLTREPRDKNEPVGIKDVLIRGKSQKANTPFNDTKDFLKTLQIQIYNKSKQDIAYVSVNVLARPTADSPLRYVVAAEFGDHQLLLAPQTTAPGRLLKPRQHAIIRLADNMYSTLEHDNATNPVSVSFKVNEVIFADDTMWYLGERLTRDPANPMSFKVVRPKLNHARKPGKVHTTLEATPSLVDEYCDLSLLAHTTLLCSQQNTNSSCRKAFDAWEDHSGSLKFDNTSRVNCYGNPDTCPWCETSTLLVGCGGGGGGGGGFGRNRGDACAFDTDCDWGLTCQSDPYSSSGYSCEDDAYFN